jgi:hypothetical protein
MKTNLLIRQSLRNPNEQNLACNVDRQGGSMIKPLLLVLALVLVPTTSFADKDLAEAGDGDHWDCANDPVVNISYSGGTFMFTGACDEININGSSIKATIADTKTLNLNGAKNAITLAEVGEININGASNKVTWKKAKTGKRPVVATNGKGNSVAKGK